jgi:hypothetical protein
LNFSSLQKAKNKKSKIDLSSSFRVNVDASTNNWQFKNLENRHELLEKEKKRLKKLNFNQSSIKKHASLNSLKLTDSLETLSMANNQKNKETEIEILNRQRSSSTSYLNELDDYGDHRKLSDNTREENNLFENESKFKKQNSIETEMEDNISLTSKNNFNDESDKSSNSSSQSTDATDSEDNEDLYAIYENDETLQAIDCDPGKNLKQF